MESTVLKEAKKGRSLSTWFIMSVSILHTLKKISGNISCENTHLPIYLFIYVFLKKLKHKQVTEQPTLSFDPSSSSEASCKLTPDELEEQIRELTCVILCLLIPVFCSVMFCQLHFAPWCADHNLGHVFLWDIQLWIIKA